MSNLAPVLLASLGLLFGSAESDPPCELRDAGAREGRHAEFDALLGAAVHGGKVDYACFAAHEQRLDAYLATLARTNPAELSRDDRLALWINAYNAYTIKLIIERWPQIESIRDIPNRWGRRDWNVGGRMLSLDDIEHEILRKEFDESRIHFAIVCASISCPDLREEAYRGDVVDAQLEEAARAFLTNPEKGARTRISSGWLGGTNYEVRLSKIFDWFGEDFETDSRSLLDYVRPYVTEEVRAFIDSHGEDVDVEFLDYDWGLNGV